jgi:predicted ATPase
LTLGALAIGLRDSAARLDALSCADDPATDLRAVFSWSYQALSGPAARLFRLLGLHTGPDIPAVTAASLAGLPLPRTQPLLAELAAGHLISESIADSYSIHDLLRAYASQLALNDEPTGSHG